MNKFEIFILFAKTFNLYGENTERISYGRSFESYNGTYWWDRKHGEGREKNTI